MMMRLYDVVGLARIRDILRFPDKNLCRNFNQAIRTIDINDLEKFAAIRCNSL